MRFKRATIKNFKRFTHLTVQGIPETASIIVLAGPNGCGKSSFFDALHTWHKWTAAKAQSWEPDYHAKAGSPQRKGWTNDVTVDFHNPLPDNRKKIFHVRSAYRNDPDFQISHLNRMTNPLDDVQVNRMIDNDASIQKNYQRLASKGLEDLYELGEGTTTFDQYRDHSLGRIRNALERLFPDLRLGSLGNPLKEGTFRFTKGASKRFSFKNLSGGEKAAFDLILDLAVVGKDYNNTVFCIDEPESHMNARLQADLLSVLHDLITDDCQVMLATHSIGMMRRARDIERAEPGTVAFLDFGDRDYDVAQVIEPTTISRAFWNRAYGVALDEVAALLAPERVVICEGHPHGTVKNHSHDARCYERIFEGEFPETKFLSGGNDIEVGRDRWGVAAGLKLLIGGLEVVRLIDRDDRSSEEIAELPRSVRVLSRRNLESYLFDDEILRALALSAGKRDASGDLIAEKNAILVRRTQDAKDDLKRASGEIYIACKRVLGLTKCGNNTSSFMRTTLAPLVTPDTSVYRQMRDDVFGRKVDCKSPAG